MKLSFLVALGLAVATLTACANRTGGAADGGGGAGVTTKGAIDTSVPLPPLQREFRGLFVATVGNADWPSRPGLSTGQQQTELLAILDRAAQLRFNVVILQVRPMCDALYPSPHDPWSEYLSGASGRPPQPGWDPLAFAINEAHKRGLELHAWFNPFRARHAEARSAPAASHITQRRADWVVRYGDQLWLDPGEPGVREYAITVAVDVVKRYDVDGVHFDDYFYPYPVKGPDGKLLPFPDDASYARYGGGASRGDWRRANVNDFVQRLYSSVKHERRTAKVGISPFGIWRPGHPEGIRGLDAFDAVYADSLLWLVSGWVDYFAPQLYWRIDQSGQGYAVLLGWWAAQNTNRRTLCPASNASKIGSLGWPAQEIIEQFRFARGEEGVRGQVLFSARAIMQNRGGLADKLARQVYTTPALTPSSPWLATSPPDAPRLEATRAAAGGAVRLRWSPAWDVRPRWWVVQYQRGGKWSLALLPGSASSYEIAAEAGGPELIALCAVDGAGMMSPPVVVR